MDLLPGETSIHKYADSFGELCLWDSILREWHYYVRVIYWPFNYIYQPTTDKHPPASSSSDPEQQHKYSKDCEEMAVPFCSNISVINSVVRSSAETYNYVVNWTFAYAKLFPNVTSRQYHSTTGNQEKNPVAAAKKKSAINCNRIKSRGREWAED